MREYEERGIGLAYCKKHYFQAHTLPIEHATLTQKSWAQKTREERTCLSLKWILHLVCQVFFGTSDSTDFWFDWMLETVQNARVWKSRDFWFLLINSKVAEHSASFRSGVKEPILHLECNLLKHHQFRFTSSSIFLAPSPKPIHLKMAQRKKNPKEGGGRVGTRAFPDFCMREEATKLWYLQFNREEGVLQLSSSKCITLSSAPRHFSLFFHFFKRRGTFIHYKSKEEMWQWLAVSHKEWDWAAGAPSRSISSAVFSPE